MPTQGLRTSFSPQFMLVKLSDFEQKIITLCQMIGLDARLLELDHIAMRINQIQQAQLAEVAWNTVGEILSKAMINGRPIVVIELDEAINVGCWKTRCVELPYPAENKVYAKQGWEHVEFVVPCHATSVEDFLDVVRQRFPVLDAVWDSLVDLGVKVKMSSPQAEHERLPNPTIAFKWDNVCIKLHPHSLKAVIASEQ
jgi:uncharacterized protein